jgi:hypothetical protein
MTRRRVVLTGNSGWTTRAAAHSSRYVPAGGTADPSEPGKPDRVANNLTPKQLEKKRARLLILLNRMRTARKDGEDAAIPLLWAQAKRALGEVYGAKAAQIGIYKEMDSHYAWARRSLKAKKPARNAVVSFGAAGPSKAPAAPPRSGRTDVRTARCIHDLVMDQCGHCLPPVARKSSSRRSPR